MAPPIFSREELQVAVDAAHGALSLDAARKYGLVTGGPDVDVEACEEMLERGRRAGITPAADAAARFATELAQP